MYSAASLGLALSLFLPACGSPAAVPTSLAFFYFNAAHETEQREGAPPVFDKYYDVRWQYFASQKRPAAEGDPKEDEWIRSHLTRHESFERMGFRIEALRESADLERKMFMERVFCYLQCELLYRMLLFNYCLVQDVCGMRIVHSSVPDGLSGACYIETAMRYYLDSTLVFLQSFPAVANELESTELAEKLERARAGFNRRNNLEDPRDACGSSGPRR